MQLLAIWFSGVAIRGELGVKVFSLLMSYIFLRYYMIPILEIHYIQTETRYQSQYLLFVWLNVS